MYNLYKIDTRAINHADKRGNEISPIMHQLLFNYATKKIGSEDSITEIVNGYRVLIDLEFNVVLKHRESSEHIGRHAGCDFPRFFYGT